jgi:hypothetical protein
MQFAAKEKVTDDKNIVCKEGYFSGQRSFRENLKYYQGLLIF